MKKITAAILSMVMLLSLTACFKSPVEKVAAFVEKNGQMGDSGYFYRWDGTSEILMTNDNSLTNMFHDNDKMDVSGKFEVNSDETGISLALLEECDTGVSGLVMKRGIVIDADGSFRYKNVIEAEGQTIGVSIEGKIDPATYTKDTMPEVTDYEFSLEEGEMSDGVKEAMKAYVDFSIECYAKMLAQDGLGLTLADVGFLAY